MDHKLICWADYAIPVPLWAEWMAMDESGIWYIYATEPQYGLTMWGLELDEAAPISAVGLKGIAPPEPGPWTEQLYYIK